MAVAKMAIRKQADMSRNKDLAGQTVYKDGYATTYDEDGYATKAVKSTSPSYSGHTDPTKEKSGYTTDKNMWTDEQMLTADDLRKIADLRAQGAAGSISWAEANAQANAIRQGYGYTIDQNGTVVDQQAAERAAAAQKDTGATKAYDKASGTYQPIVSPPQTNVGTVGTTGTAAQGGTSLPSGTGTASGGGATGQYVTPGGFDYSDYIKDLYALKMEAELADLEAAYEKNVGSLKSAGEQIGKTYQAERNQAAAQNEVSLRNMNEYFTARGLNTGTQGQMALAQDTALQGQLGNLAAQEAQALTDNRRQMDELERVYLLNTQQVKAENGAAEAQALYEELIRQGEAARQQAELERQYALAQQKYQDSLNSDAAKKARDLAMTMLSYGVMPPSETLAAAGISAQEAQGLQSAYLQKLAGTGKTGSSGGTSGGPETKSTPAKPVLTVAQVNEAIENGNLSPNVLDAYRYYYGESYSAGNGGTEAPMAFTDLKRTISALLAQGKDEEAAKISETYFPRLTTVQQNELNRLYQNYGY